MFTKLETVTPADAKRMLSDTEKNGAQNRALSKRRVSLIAEAIKKGDYKTTHQGIALDKKGSVVDGQHRLHGIVESDTAVRMLVTRGLEDDAMQVIDRGRSRTLGDVVSIGGMSYGNRRVAIARSIIQFIRDEGEGKSENMDVLDSDVLDVMAKFSDGIEWVLRLPKTQRYASAAMQAVFVIAYLCFPTSIEELGQKFFTGSDLEKDSPMLTLRNHLSRAGQTDLYLRRFAGKMRMMRITFNALKHAVLKEPMVKINDSIRGYEFFKYCED
jgi:hypothetical protein